MSELQNYIHPLWNSPTGKNSTDVMVMSIRTVRRMAAEILKCGENRIWIDPERMEEAKKAITRADVRQLIKKKIIRKIKEKEGENPGKEYRRKQKERGRRRGHGSRKGAKGARTGDKTDWLIRIRAQRKLLKELKDKGQITPSVYRKVYRLAKGGEFRSKKHLLTYLQENELIKVQEK